MKKLLKRKPLLIILFILFLIGLNIFQKEVKASVISLSLPLQSSVWQKGNGAANFFFSFLYAPRLLGEIQRLQGEKEILQQKMAALESLQKENEQLAVAIKNSVFKDFAVIEAKIAGKELGQEIIFLNQGKGAGIKEGMPVITGNRAVAGKVQEVFENFSKVMLISNPDFSFDAKIVGKEVIGVVKTKDGKLVFDLILQEKEILPGDIVATSHLGGIFPKDLLVGEIKELKKADTEAFQLGIIDKSLDLRREHILFVIK